MPLKGDSFLRARKSGSKSGFEAKIFNAIFGNFKFKMHNSKVLDPYNENW